jgi:type IV pilus assembly protein PilW
MDGIVDRYDNWNLTAADNPLWPAFPTPAVLNACARIKTSAVRIALVARNANYEKTDPVTDTNVTMTMPTWEASTAHAAPNPPTAADRISWAANPIDLSANTGLSAPATWRNYRYKVLQTVVPLRNLTLAWQGVPTGC